jgi:hypothetical protein
MYPSHLFPLLNLFLATGLTGPDSSFAHRFLLEDPASPATQAFLQDIGACAQESPAFSHLLQEIPDSAPLPVRGLAPATSILFAESSDPKSDQPHLTVDLGDLHILPTVRAVRF